MFVWLSWPPACWIPILPSPLFVIKRFYLWMHSPFQSDYWQIASPYKMNAADSEQIHGSHLAQGCYLGEQETSIHDLMDQVQKLSTELSLVSKQLVVAVKSRSTPKPTKL